MHIDITFDADFNSDKRGLQLVDERIDKKPTVCTNCMLWAFLFFIIVMSLILFCWLTWHHFA